MNAEDFFDLPEVRRVIERAARSAGTPLSVHHVAHNQEGPRIAGTGACAACSYVSDLPRGRWACRASRRSAASMALAQNRPLGFICHLGFACVSAPAVPGEHLVLTFGPYVPANADQSLEHDVRNGLAALDVNIPPEVPLPVTLDDIHRAPADAVPAVTEWTMEALAPLWADWCAAQSPDEPAEAEVSPASVVQPARHRKSDEPYRDRFAQNLAAAIAGANQPQARALLRGRAEELQAGKRPSLPVRRATMVRLVADVLVAIEHAGLAASAAWDAFPAFLAAVRTARKEGDLLDAAMGVLGVVKRNVAKTAPDQAPAYEKLNEMLNEKLTEQVTLTEAAETLGIEPSTLSQRLRRKFNMNFSEYLGRLRIDKAKELLRQTKLSATEIARRVGVMDQSHFSKLFKKFEGVSPLEYRERFGRKK